MKKLKILFVICLSSLLLGASSCSTKEKPDAYRCIIINVDSAGNKMPLENWYWFCVNEKTKEEKTKWLKDSHTCLLDQARNCKWIGADTVEFKKAEEFYLNQQGK